MKTRSRTSSKRNIAPDPALKTDHKAILPVETEVIITMSGEVIFADLEASLVEVAHCIAPEDERFELPDQNGVSPR